MDIAGPNLLGVSLSDDYAQGIEAAGGIPVVIPFYEDLTSVSSLIQRLDGLLLSGGEDIDPLMFGEQPRRGLGSVVPERDALEKALIEGMMEQGKPIFAICRGIQVLNAVLGGTLYQDLPSQWPSDIQHSQKARRNHLSHALTIDTASKLHTLLGEQSEVYCNSFHHQAVKDCAPGLRPVAWDRDGLIEAVEHETADFVVAVQWHPENLWRTTPYYHGLFRGFVEASSRVRANS
ncbi:gamma-glutamyl-gamma-aminobutyrate hydrolase family protein [Alicyclobacillus curvatus]|nr:gamma-glutamyl-gamma-aminobutyrate hydrolase family protein [Alicyclobacillus curvatus]